MILAALLVSPIPAVVALGADEGFVSQTPQQILGSNCELWLRADLGVSLNGSTGHVSAWRDQCHGITFSQSTGALQPGYTSGYAGSASVNFVGASGTYLQGGSYTEPSGFEVLSVGTAIVPPSGTNNYMWSLGGAGGYGFANAGAGSPNNFFIAFSNDGPIALYGTTSPTGEIVADAIGTSGTIYSIAVNNGTAATGNPNGALPSASVLTLGCASNITQCSTMSAQEIILSKTTLTATQQRQLVVYFAANYGVP
jgi:hypothetical protein